MLPICSILQTAASRTDRNAYMPLNFVVEHVTVIDDLVIAV
jgi:hypothetical protein